MCARHRLNSNALKTSSIWNSNTGNKFTALWNTAYTPTAYKLYTYSTNIQICPYYINIDS